MLEMVFTVLLFGGAPLLFLVVLPFWWARSVRKGLRTRRSQPCAVQTHSDAFLVRTGAREQSFPFPSVVRCRFAINANWTESKLVENALTLFDTTGKPLVKVPSSAAGFEQLVLALKDRNIPIDKVEVDAPAFLD